MKSPSFDLHRPTSLDEALALLAEHRDDVKVLAGGQSLVPLLNFRLAHPEVVVDIARVPGLDTITVDGTGLRIGTMTRHTAVEHSAAVERSCPLITRAMAHIAHPPIRNRGTFGGSLAHADPAAELPAVALALDAVFDVVSVRGERQIAAADFFEGFLTTALDDDEMLRSVHFPMWPDGAGAAFHEVSRRQGDFAMVGVAVAAGTDDEGRTTTPRIAFCGVSDTPVRLREVEELVTGRVFDDAVRREAEGLVRETLSPPGDLHATSEYRKAVAGTLMTRAIAEAIGATNDVERSAS